ncbi:MAG: right-handed parallel beta-helix repeat-containing protein [Betaproteobacteria bacterium]|nr:right-handed parallel beta-helix repeat-containing protein [Betaproteobacteria bacterium]
MLVSVVAAQATAATLRVSPQGEDRAADGSAARPFRSLQLAADRAQPGDVIEVADGLYAPFHVTRDGRAGQPVTFRASGRGAIIAGTSRFDDRDVAISILASHIVLEGFDVRVGARDDSRRSRGIRVSGVHDRHVSHVQLRGNTVSEAGWVGITVSYADDMVIEGNEVWGSRGQHGIYLANSGDRPVVRNNVVHDNREAGIQLNGDPRLPGDGIISGALISGNRIYRNGRGGSAALNLASVRDSLVVNNLLYENASQGIASWDDRAGERFGCKDNRYLHNTVVMPPGARHVFSLRHGSTGAAVKYNIFINLGGKDALAVDRASMTGLASDFNVIARVENADEELVSLAQWQRKSSQDRQSRSADAQALFVDTAKHDYRLREGSPAVDAIPVAVDTSVKSDIEGNARPQSGGADIGAFERLSTPVVVPSAAQNARGMTKSR